MAGNDVSVKEEVWMEKREGEIAKDRLNTETMVLGVLFQGTKKPRFIEIQKEISGDTFQKKENKIIFSAMERVIDKGLEISPAVVSQELMNSNELEKVGGVATLLRLSESSIYDIKNIDSNIQFLVREKERKAYRDFLSSSAFLLDSGRLTDEVREKIHQEFFNLTKPKGRGSYSSLKTMMMETIERIEYDHKHPEKTTGVFTGYPNLDSILPGFQNGEMIIIGARPGAGKTSLALDMARHMSIYDQVGVGFLSLEMTQDALMKRLISMETKTTLRRLRQARELEEEEVKNIRKGASSFWDSPLYIEYGENTQLTEVKRIAREMKIQEDIKILFIDYFGRITTDFKKNAPRWELMSMVSSQLKDLALELDIPIVVLSQLTREFDGREPKLSALRDTGSLEQDADVVIFLYKVPEEEDKLWTGTANKEYTIRAIVAKNRNGDTGTLEFIFSPQWTRFIAAGADYSPEVKYVPPKEMKSTVNSWKTQEPEPIPQEPEIEDLLGKNFEDFEKEFENDFPS